MIKKHQPPSRHCSPRCDVIHIYIYIYTSAQHILHTLNVIAVELKILEADGNNIVGM